MRILFANNFFYLRGGSERVFFDEAALLESRGHEVFYFATQSERNQPTPYTKYFVSELKYKLKNVARFIYCLESKKKIQEMIDDLKPDICHLHNIYQDMSPSVLPVLRKNGIPSYVTLHDYKLICPNYNMTHDFAVCEDCRGGRFYKCVLNRCKQGSYVYSAVPALEAYVHRALNIWKGNVESFISPSKFLRSKVIEFGWPEETVKYVPNFLDTSKYVPKYDSEPYFVYVGRLSKEKGIGTLINAFMKIRKPSIQLVIVGEGPIRDQLVAQSASDKRVCFTGYLSGQQLADATRNARFMIVPSEWYENAPISILEAFAQGKPVIGARIGGIPEMIDDGVSGFLFESGNVEDLKAKLELAFDMTEAKVKDMGKAARAKIEKEYNTDAHYEGLMKVYRKASGEVGKA